MRVKSVSGAMRNPSAAMIWPSGDRMGATANMVGTPARRLPCSSGNSATLGKGRVIRTLPARHGANCSTSPGGDFMPTSWSRPEATTRKFVSSTKNPLKPRRSSTGFRWARNAESCGAVSNAAWTCGLDFAC
jgi:hypothetical protein